VPRLTVPMNCDQIRTPHRAAAPSTGMRDPNMPIGPRAANGSEPQAMTHIRPILCGLIAFCGLAVVAAAEEPKWPVLHTEQDYIDQVMRPSTLNVNDPMAVFDFVFTTLPERVKVYPTENYYYFTFINDGAPFDGNIRLDASNRDQGKVIFAYSEDLEEYRNETPVQHLILDESQGVKLEKVENFVYRMTYKGKSVVFELNDLSNVKPPANALAPDEEFIGPTFDESGIRFFLVFDKRLKIFHFILDETVKVADQFEPTKKSDRILIGKRTGFAFYRDHLRERKIMIGAFEGNMVTNSYFDGPFDQLPDNFIQGDMLKDAIIAAAPEMKGRIDRFGAWGDGSERFAIDPYIAYRMLDDLSMFDDCAQARQKQPHSYYLCFAIDYDQRHHPHLRGLADIKSPRAHQRRARN
jgi:hypothetical protein